MPPKAARVDRTPSPEAAPMRERIKAIAKDLYVRRGYDGFSFADIAATLGTTRANIHYHFGSKHQLVVEIIDDFVADALDRVGRHWAQPDRPLAAKFAAQLADLRAFYRRFNRADGERQFWSPLARLRHDGEVLGKLSFDVLERINHAFSGYIRQGLKQAIAAGELAADTPVDDVVLQLRAMILSCGPMTQDTGSFAEVERLFRAFRTTLEAAYGTGAKRRRRAAG